MGKNIWLVLLLQGILLSGCDWVDSAGRDNNSAPTTEIILEDGQMPGPQILEEQETARITVVGNDSDGVVNRWQWSAAPIEQGDLAECRDVVGFPGDLAADSLEAACTSSTDCLVQFDQQSNAAGSAEFLFTAPTLDSPVGLRYRLTVTDNDGGRGSNEYTFCLNSVNEPPIAVDDTFTVLEGQVLDITAADVNLLSNDTDDTDVRSDALKIDLSSSLRPSSADVFELRADGGFTYAFRGSNLVGNISDSFDYFVTDGEFSVKATATINVVARNDMPVANGTIGTLEEIAGIDFSIDFADFFTDPEGNTLGFSVLDGDFPESGSISLSPVGVLSGAAGALDVGDYDFTLLVSDGVESTTANITMSILENEAVTVRPIPDEVVTVDSSLIFAVGSFFTDPEGQALRYSIASTDNEVNLSINPVTGVIAGFISDDGDYDIQVSASDGFNPASSTTMTFTAEAGNLPPVFSGTIASQSIDFGRAITPIRPNFTDPEDEDMTFRLQGISPTGLSLSDTGTLTGRPLQIGVFPNLRIVATDEGGLSALSNSFTLTIAR